MQLVFDPEWITYISYCFYHSPPWMNPCLIEQALRISVNVQVSIPKFRIQHNPRFNKYWMRTTKHNHHQLHTISYDQSSNKNTEDKDYIAQAALLWACHQNICMQRYLPTKSNITHTVILQMCVLFLFISISKVIYSASLASEKLFLNRIRGNTWFNE